MKNSIAVILINWKPDECAVVEKQRKYPTETTHKKRSFTRYFFDIF